jgi:tetratricopeptide (TPR) repeat protein
MRESTYLLIVGRIVALSFILLISASSVLKAQQVFPVRVEGMIISPYSFDLSVYAFERSQDIMFVATLQDPVEPFRLIKFRLSILNNGQEIMATNPNFNPPPIILEKDIPMMLSGSDLAAYFDDNNLVGFNGQQSGTLLPEGLNGFCLEVIDVQRNEIISDKFCSFGYFEYSDPPLLNSPVCGDVIQENMIQNLLFNWIPQHQSSLNPPMGVEYEFKLVELLPDQNAFDAFSFSLPLYETTVMGTSLFYLEDAPLLESGKQYAWRIRAVDTQNFGLFSNNGYSLVCTFFVEKAEEDDGAASFNCANATCNWTGNLSTGLLEQPLEIGDKVGIGYFEMELTDVQSLDNQYYSGEGNIYVPFLSAKLRVEFDDILVNEDQRIYSGNVFTVEADSSILIPELFNIQNPMPIPAGVENLDENFSEDNAWALHMYFDEYKDGDTPPNLVSLLSAVPEQNAVPITVPVGLDNETATDDLVQTIAITGARFEPTKAVLNAVMVTRFNELSNWLKFGVKEFCFQPQGLAQAGASTLELLSDMELDLLEGEIIVNGTNSQNKGTSLAWDCNGFDNFSISGTYSYDVNHFLNLEKPAGYVSSEFTSTAFTFSNFHLDVLPFNQFLVLDTIIENKPWFDDLQVIRIKKHDEYQHLPKHIERAAELLGEDHFMYNFLKAAQYELEGYNLLAVDPENTNAEEIYQRAQKAIPLFKAALDLQEENALDHVLLSEAYLRINKLDSAFAHSKKSVTYSPKWVVGYNQVASIYLRNGQTTLASKWLDKAINLRPKDITNYNARGFNSLSSAFRSSFKYRDKWKLNSFTFDGLIDYDLDKFKEVEFWYKKSINLLPTGSAYKQLAWCYSRIGNNDEAELLLKEAIENKVSTKEHIKDLAFIYAKTDRLPKLNEIIETIELIDTSSFKEDTGGLEPLESVEEPEPVLTESIDDEKENSKGKSDSKEKEGGSQKEKVDEVIKPIVYDTIVVGDKVMIVESDRVSYDTDGSAYDQKLTRFRPNIESGGWLLQEDEYHEVKAYASLLANDTDQFDTNFAKLKENASGDPKLLYEISRAFAVQNQVEKSLDYLELAIKSGYSEKYDIENNTDLDSIRSDQRYQDVITQLNE